MAQFIAISRRLFLARLGKGTMALVVLGACGDQGTTTTIGQGSATTLAPTTTASPATTSASASTSTTGSTATPLFHRVNLGFVSAYLVVRGSEAAVVDTGVAGSEGDIEAGLGELGLSWDAVGHVVLTHHHPDHVGSVSPVMEAAAASTGYIGEADLDNVSSPRELVPLVDGEEVFGLTVIHTPGHTEGHISLLDPAAGVLVAGDAINGADGGVTGPNPQFSSDHDQALASMAKLATFQFETIYFGHGEPVLTGGADKLRAEVGGGRY
ncbi:MAG TPA: MBL fold metallo-hydrolase [Acidimicrobiia bacterium]|nr:MBL fold metallo-hydrolase [Acidimicrobiia bacterium]